MSTAVNDAVAYAMSDMAPSADGRLPAGVVSVPEPNGCGRQHKAQTDDQGRPYVKCAVCAPWLVGHLHGFAATPAGVPLTPDEMGEVEISKRQGEVSYSMAMKAMGQTMAQMIQQGQAPALGLPAGTPAGPPPLTASGLKAQLAGMSAADRAEIAAMLTGQGAVSPGSQAPLPGDDIPRSRLDMGRQAAAEPVKRGPGRPRKVS